MAVDLAGPFRHAGRDFNHKDYKYLTVAAYRVPKSCLQTMNVKEVEQELQAPEEPPLPDDLFDHGEGAVMEEKGIGDLGKPSSELRMDEIDEQSDLEEDMNLADLLDLPNLDDGDDVEPPGPLEAREGGQGEGEMIKAKDKPDPIDEKLVDGLTKPVEMVTVYLSRPLRRRTGHNVGDPGSGSSTCASWFTSSEPAQRPGQRVWHDSAEELADTTANQPDETSGGEPAGNATAELGVRRGRC